MPPLDLRVDGIRFGLGQNDGFRITEELPSSELRAQMRAALIGNINTSAPVAIDGYDRRSRLATAVELVILDGHQGAALEAPQAVERRRCLLIEAGHYVPPWDHDEPSSDPGA